LAVAGLRARPVRSGLSALGIAIGIAAIVGVTGVSASSRAALLARLDRLGTNLLTVEPGQPLAGERVQLSEAATGMIRRIPLVESAAAIGAVPDGSVLRSPFVPGYATGGIGMLAVDPDLPDVVGARLQAGTFLNAATSHFPVTVLGATAAAHLGVSDIRDRIQVWLGGRPFVVIGILDPVELAPQIDRSALVGWAAATSLLVFDGHPTEVALRAQPSAVTTVRDVLARTTDPEHPEDIPVSRPSDALVAQTVVDENLLSLLLALGAVALVVGAIGIANVLLVGVLERRREIGVRRAIGATSGHVAMQFLMEALVLGTIGGLIGCVLGAAATAVVALARGWLLDVPAIALVAALGTSVVVAAVAGALPAIRAARLPPMEALRAE
jgi:putative ABC transport system permease protein